VSPAATARLVWERSDGERVEFPLDAETLVVGREDAAICIDEPLVSRQHARIERRDDGWRLVDLGSTNLTRVNGEIVRERDLVHGDEIRFARAACRFLLADKAGPQE
jgi:pSer/pThr/pTyr-binding forkhead associated (FHA) protein